MKLPCQSIVWNVLPALRAAIAEELIALGVSRMEAARLLEMTPPAISHYRTGKRGYRIVFEGDARGPLSRLGRDLKGDRVEDLASRICEICIQIRGENLLEGSCGTDA